MHLYVFLKEKSVILIPSQISFFFHRPYLLQKQKDYIRCHTWNEKVSLFEWCNMEQNARNTYTHEIHGDTFVYIIVPNLISAKKYFLALSCIQVDKFCRFLWQRGPILAVENIIICYLLNLLEKCHVIDGCYMLLRRLDKKSYLQDICTTKRNKVISAIFVQQWSFLLIRISMTNWREIEPFIRTKSTAISTLRNTVLNTYLK